MSRLQDVTTVACPYEDVPDRLSALFGGDVGTMPMLLMVGDLGVERGVEILL